MICLAVGFGILAFVAMRRAHRRCYGHHGFGWHGPWAYYGHHHGRRQRWFLHALFARIDATPAQERAIVAEMAKLQERVWLAKSSLRDARGDLAASLRGPVLDDAALGAVLGRVDAASSEVRNAAIDALRNVHGLLDDGQRAQVADLLDGGIGFGGFWRSGPYR